MSGYDFKYDPAGPTIPAFMKDESFVRGIRGPIGSGKSVSCCVEVFRRCLEQWPQDQSRPPSDANPRRSRWAIIRNTAPELKTTTIKTWLDWFPEEVFGDFNWSPPYTHHIRRFGLDVEVLFLALDRPEDVKKLLSLELTGVWVNEAREVQKIIIDGATSRVGRFPSMREGGARWCGVIMDTNAPDDDHWWPIVSGEAPVPDWMPAEDALMLVKPDNWRFFTQPPGMVEEFDDDGNVTGYALNYDADNIKNLRPDYYPNLIRGKPRSWINIYVMNRLGTIEDGKPIYRSFVDESHVAKADIEPVEGKDVHVGVDFGLTPAATIAQRLNGRWLITDELVAGDMGATRFSQLLRQLLIERYPWLYANGNTDKPVGLIITGDPAGDQRAQTDETTPFEVFRANGLPIRPASTNSFDLRVDAVEQPLQRMVDGKPYVLVSPRCKTLRKAMASGYQYARLKVQGTARYAERPDKNRYSHVAEALQYMMLGGGEGRALIRPKEAPKPVVAKRRDSPFASLDARRRR